MLVLQRLVEATKEKKPGVLPALSRLLSNAPPEIVCDLSLEEKKHWEVIISSSGAPILTAAGGGQALTT